MIRRKSKPTDPTARRATIEQIIARYPSIGQDELFILFAYFRHEASATDRRQIAANRSIRPQYRQFAADHRPELLRLTEIGCYVVLAFLLVVICVILAFGTW